MPRQAGLGRRAAEYARYRRRALEFLGGRCVVCGTVENLKIHHKNPGDKGFNPIILTADKSGQRRKELEKCQLLCAEHHRERHEKKHGGSRRYLAGCRCNECVAGESTRQKLIWENRKPKQRTEEYRAARRIYIKKWLDEKPEKRNAINLRKRRWREARKVRNFHVES